jgi:hypothetical protein
MVSAQSPFGRPRFASLRPWPAARHESRKAEKRSIRPASRDPLDPCLLAKLPQSHKEIRRRPSHGPAEPWAQPAATILQCGAPISTDFAPASEQRRESSRNPAVRRTSFSWLGAACPTYGTGSATSAASSPAVSCRCRTLTAARGPRKGGHQEPARTTWQGRSGAMTQCDKRKLRRYDAKQRRRCWRQRERAGWWRRSAGTGCPRARCTSGWRGRPRRRERSGSGGHRGAARSRDPGRVAPATRAGTEPDPEAAAPAPDQGCGGHGARRDDRGRVPAAAGEDARARRALRGGAPQSALAHGFRTCTSTAPRCTR